MPVPVTRRHDAHRFAQPRSAEISLNRDSSAFSQNAVSPWSLLQKLRECFIYFQILLIKLLTKI